MKETLQPIQGEHSHLHVTNRQITGTWVATPAGETDMATAPAFRTCLLRLLNRWRQPVVVDLSRLTFIDSSGLNALVAAHRRATQLGCQFSLAAPTEQVAKVLKSTRLDTLMPIHRRLEDACAHGALAPTACDTESVKPGLASARSASSAAVPGQAVRSTASP